jgi:hypothetical protein
MATKYIVNDLTGQTITGNLTINGNIIVTGTSNSNSVYRALLTQTGPITGTNLSDFNYGLIVGETYTITDYVSDDDFSNIANVQSGGTIIFDYVGTAPGVGYGVFNGVTGTTSGLGSGATFNVYWCGATYNQVTVASSGVDYVVGDTITILGTSVSGSTPANDITITITDLTPTETGCVFIATGQTPNYWGEGSELVSDGGLIVDVLENTLGYELFWVQTPFGGYGYYIAVNSTSGPIYNSFQRDKVEVITPLKYPFDNGGPSFPPFIVPGIDSYFNKDSQIFIDVYDFMGGLSNELLYYTPIEIKINQDPLTPVIAYGLNVSSFPYGNISIDVITGENYVQTFYGDYVLVNNINELVIALNNDTTINYLGTFSVNEGVENGIILTTTERIKNQFSPNNTLTFEAFND